MREKGGNAAQQAMTATHLKNPAGECLICQLRVRRGEGEGEEGEGEEGEGKEALDENYSFFFFLRNYGLNKHGTRRTTVRMRLLYN